MRWLKTFFSPLGDTPQNLPKSSAWTLIWGVFLSLSMFGAFFMVAGAPLSPPAWDYFVVALLFFAIGSLALGGIKRIWRKTGSEFLRKLAKFLLGICLFFVPFFMVNTISEARKLTLAVFVQSGSFVLLGALLWLLFRSLSVYNTAAKPETTAEHSRTVPPQEAVSDVPPQMPRSSFGAQLRQLFPAFWLAALCVAAFCTLLAVGGKPGFLLHGIFAAIFLVISLVIGIRKKATWLTRGSVLAGLVYYGIYICAAFGVPEFIRKIKGVHFVGLWASFAFCLLALALILIPLVCTHCKNKRLPHLLDLRYSDNELMTLQSFSRYRMAGYYLLKAKLHNIITYTVVQVGSSASRRSGLPTMARAIATLWHCPPES